VSGGRDLYTHQEYFSDMFEGCVQCRVSSVWFCCGSIDCTGRLSVCMSAVACRPVTPRLWSGFLVWLLQKVPVAPSRMVWRVLRCRSMRGNSRLPMLFSCLFCLLKRGSVYTCSTVIGCISRCFGCTFLGFIARGMNWQRHLLFYHGQLFLHDWLDWCYKKWALLQSRSALRKDQACCCTGFKGYKGY
jgi:hypothetical protein